MQYQTKLIVVEAEQYQVGKELQLPVELIRYEGVGGYAGRLAYVKNERGELLTVRPNDWIVIEEGKPPKIMTDYDFLNTYELTKQVKRVKKAASKSDNAELKAPDLT